MNELAFGALCVDVLLHLTPQVEDMSTLLEAAKDEEVRV